MALLKSCFGILIFVQLAFLLLVQANQPYEECLLLIPNSFQLGRELYHDYAVVWQKPISAHQTGMLQIGKRESDFAEMLRKAGYILVSPRDWAEKKFCKQICVDNTNCGKELLSIYQSRSPKGETYVYNHDELVAVKSAKPLGKKRMEVRFSTLSTRHKAKLLAQRYHSYARLITKFKLADDQAHGMGYYNSAAMPSDRLCLLEWQKNFMYRSHACSTSRLLRVIANNHLGLSGSFSCLNRNRNSFFVATPLHGLPLTTSRPHRSLSTAVNARYPVAMLGRVHVAEVTGQIESKTMSLLNPMVALENKLQVTLDYNTINEFFSDRRFKRVDHMGIDTTIYIAGRHGAAVPGATPDAEELLFTLSTMFGQARNSKKKTKALLISLAGLLATILAKTNGGGGVYNDIKRHVLNFCHIENDEAEKVKPLGKNVTQLLNSLENGEDIETDACPSDPEEASCYFSAFQHNIQKLAARTPKQACITRDVATTSTSRKKVAKGAVRGGAQPPATIAASSVNAGVNDGKQPGKEPKIAVASPPEQVTRPGGGSGKNELLVAKDQTDSQDKGKETDNQTAQPSNKVPALVEVSHTRASQQKDRSDNERGKMVAGSADLQKNQHAIGTERSAQRQHESKPEGSQDVTATATQVGPVTDHKTKNAATLIEAAVKEAGVGSPRGYRQPAADPAQVRAPQEKPARQIILVKSTPVVVQEQTNLHVVTAFKEDADGGKTSKLVKNVEYLDQSDVQLSGTYLRNVSYDNVAREDSSAQIEAEISKIKQGKIRCVVEQLDVRGTVSYEEMKAVMGLRKNDCAIENMIMLNNSNDQLRLDTMGRREQQQYNDFLKLKVQKICSRYTADTILEYLAWHQLTSVWARICSGKRHKLGVLDVSAPVETLPVDLVTTLPAVMSNALAGSRLILTYRQWFKLTSAISKLSRCADGVYYPSAQCVKFKAVISNYAHFPHAVKFVINRLKIEAANKVTVVLDDKLSTKETMLDADDVVKLIKNGYRFGVPMVKPDGCGRTPYPLEGIKYKSELTGEIKTWNGVMIPRLQTVFKGKDFERKKLNKIRPSFFSASNEVYADPGEMHEGLSGNYEEYDQSYFEEYE